jgi:hypothetical protein
MTVMAVKPGSRTPIAAKIHKLNPASPDPAIAVIPNSDNPVAAIAILLVAETPVAPVLGTPNLGIKATIITYSTPHAAVMSP